LLWFGSTMSCKSSCVESLVPSIQR
jgi:hypothetical protein